MPRGRLSYPSHIPAYSGSWEETRQPVGNPWGHVESIGNCGESVSWAQDQTLDLWVDNTAHCPACWPESVLHYYSKSATFKEGQSTQIVSWLKLSCCSKINTPFPNPNPRTFVLDNSYPPTSSPLSPSYNNEQPVRIKAMLWDTWIQPTTSLPTVAHAASQDTVTQSEESSICPPQHTVHELTNIHDCLVLLWKATPKQNRKIFMLKISLTACLIHFHYCIHFH